MFEVILFRPQSFLKDQRIRGRKICYSSRIEFSIWKWDITGWLACWGIDLWLVIEIQVGDRKKLENIKYYVYLHMAPYMFTSKKYFGWGKTFYFTTHKSHFQKLSDILKLNLPGEGCILCSGIVHSPLRGWIDLLNWSGLKMCDRSWTWYEWI